MHDPSHQADHLAKWRTVAYDRAAHFEKELKKFAQSDFSRRQIHENAHFALEIEIENARIEAEVCDLSRGVMGTEVGNVSAERFVVDTAVVLRMKWIEEDWDIENQVSAHIAWVKTEDDQLFRRSCCPPYNFYQY